MKDEILALTVTALKKHSQTISYGAYDALVSEGLLRLPDEKYETLLDIIKTQQGLISSLIQDADKHD